MKIKNVFTSIALVFGFISAGTAQMTVSTGVLTPAQYVNNLVGPGIVVSNVTYTGTTQQIGAFGGTSNIGFSSGVVISSGATTELIGPATSQSAGTVNVSGISNADLLSVANLAATAVGSGSITSTTDAAILEFDFVPVSNVVSFNFVFASDEYLTYVNSVFNDVFGFFVSGPGISGPYAAPAGFPNGSTNLALVPGTNTPITISTIHPGLNSQYYVNNSGNTHVMNGFTTPIPVTFDVICGETYHFKFAVADCQDNFLSTAVFMQDASFNSPPVSLVFDTANGTDTIPEACVDANMLFVRSTCESSFPLSVNFTVSGTATDDVDFILADSPITLAAGQDTASINIAPIIDGLVEGTESVIITVSYIDALGNPQTFSGTFYITDLVPFETNAPDLTVRCYDDSIELEVSASGGSGVYTYDWLSSNSVSTNDFVSINANGSYNYLVTVTDVCLGPLTDTVTVFMNQTIAIDSMWSFPATCDPIGYVAGFYSGITTASPNQQPSLTWYGPGQNTSNFINGSVFTDLSSGWYYFTVVDNNIGCSTNDSVFVDILTPPVANIVATPESGCSPLTVNFTNNSQNASNYAWDFGNGQTANVGTTASQTQTYTTSSVIQLIASDGNCRDTAYAFVTISICGCTDPTALNYNPLANVNDGSCFYPAPTVEVPNVFSPNNDGSNEIFFLKTTNSTNISLTILNRWGDVIFEGSSMTPGWNGKTQNGIEAEAGVYFYKYVIEGLQNQSLEGHGFLTLVR